MGEPERRRRRLRTPSAATAAAEAAATAAAEAAAPAEAAPATTAQPAGAETAAQPTAQPAPAVDADVDATVIETMAVEDPDEVTPPRPRPRLPRAPTSGAGFADDRDVERGLRGLVGSGSSQVSVGAALRARDAARPTEEHLAEAERTLAIVRRNWSPPA
jgi:hypothetical protein